MMKVAIYGLGLLALFITSMAYANVAYAQLYSGGQGSALTTTEAELEECKKLGIPEFECNQQTILAARAKVYAEANADNPYRGSGTSMLAQGLGEAGAYVAALVAVFGGISAAFFAMSRSKAPQRT